jgi:protein-disulfide isomerase
LVIYKNQLSKVKNWETYIEAIDNLVKKNWNNRTYLQDLKTKSDKLIKSNSIKNKSAIAFTQYLDAKIWTTLQYTTTNSGNSNTTTNTTYTNSGTTTETWAISSGTVIERVKNNILTKEQYNTLIAGTYFQLANQAHFSLIEFSDLQCPYCAKLHNDWIIDNMKSQYGILMDYRIIHFPLTSHPNAEIAAEIAECVWNQRGVWAFYNFINETFKNEKTDKETLIEQGVRVWAERTKLNECVNQWTFKEFIQYKKSIAEKMLGINSTPTILMRNNNSWKYVIVSWLQNLIDYQKAFESLYK